MRGRRGKDREGIYLADSHQKCRENISIAPRREKKNLSAVRNIFSFWISHRRQVTMANLCRQANKLENFSGE